MLNYKQRMMNQNIKLVNTITWKMNSDQALAYTAKMWKSIKL